MKTLKKITFLSLISLSLLSFGQSNNLDIISKKYNQLLEEKNKGVALLVKKDNKVETISLGNFGLNERAVFNIGSATKTFTAILIMQEFEKGNLQLTDSIGKYLSPIINVDASLTIEALLTHQSGLDEVVQNNILDIFYGKNDSLYNDNLLYQIEANNPDEIGKFNYCNTNYLLLGKIIEKVNDQSYFDVLRDRILVPLKMTQTYPYLHQNIPNLAAPQFQGKDVSEYLDYRFFATMAHSAGSIASTLSDMEIFYSSLFETETLLKKESVKMMMENGSKSYGYGLFKTTLNEQIHFGHGGNNIGYSFASEYNPNTKGMILMFSNDIQVASEGLIKSDLLTYLDNQVIEEFKSIDIDNFRNCVGTYLLKEANLELEIVIEGEKMFLISEAQGSKSELIQKAANAMSDTEVGVTLTLIEGDNESLTFNQNGFETTMSRIEKSK